MRKQLIKKIMYNPGLHFNELWDKKIPSNKMAYHLKVLEDENLIEKRDGGYYLTHEGKKHVTFVDGKSGERSSAPLACVIILIIKNNKLLMLHRKKEPFYGIWGLPSGKIEFNQYIMEAAKFELKEETGLEADLELKGLLCAKTFDKGKQSYSHMLFIIRGDHPKGKLHSTDEGESKWIDLDKLKSLNIFPDIPKLLEMISQDGFVHLDMNRYQEEEVFKKLDIVWEKKY